MQHQHQTPVHHHDGFFIQEQVPLHDKNWFQTGGPARFYAEPTTVVEFQKALQWAHQHTIPIFVLGQGANVLISDDGFDGLVIRPQLTGIHHVNHQHTRALVHAQAGATMDTLIEYCLNHNLIGLEEFSGIPGTVGGSVYINLHYFQFLISQFLVEAEVIDKHTGALTIVGRDWFTFGYNSSSLQQNTHYLVSAVFDVAQANDLDVAFARGRRIEIIRHRVARYPSTHTCGSFFRNFHPQEVSLYIEGTDKKLIFVAYYLDKIGVKGALRIGGAAVSHQHANMLVNKGTATSADIIKLAKIMQTLVVEQFGIIPQPECQLIGFKEYPLLGQSC